MNTQSQLIKCFSCAKQYMGDDKRARCRPNGLKCTERMAFDCKQYEDKSCTAPWLGCYPLGRGD